MNRILNETLKYLLKVSARKQLLNLRLTRYFTMAELHDGSIGACMSYYRLPDPVLDIAEERLQRYCEYDPFLVADYNVMNCLVADLVGDAEQRFLLLTSVTASIISAISAPMLRLGDNEEFTVIKELPLKWTGGAKSALIVGFGGFLRRLVAEPTVEWVHTIDFLYDPAKERYESELSNIRRQFPGKNVTASVRLRNDAELKNFDVISITGSTLCNGTLEGILEGIRSDAVIVMQGQSASIHPKYLFEAGVKWIATTLKPPLVAELAKQDRNGDAMKPLLDGHLPITYLKPVSAALNMEKQSSTGPIPRIL